MDIYKRHRRIWRFFYALLHRPICRKFNLTHDVAAPDGPCLIIANHTNAWDPLIVAMCLPKKQTYFVSSEHLFRLGALSRLIDFLVAPIPRRKAAVATDTVLACLRHLRAGRSVCIFAEGEQCWDGRTAPLSPTTGALVKKSGASLLTIHIEGGYLSLPRWAKKARKGRMRAEIAGIYSPEELSGMSEAEIAERISSDIREDCWERQAREAIAFRSKAPAEGLERALWLCPVCGRIGSLRTKKDRVFCSCGMEATMTPTGFFGDGAPYRTIAEWDREQIRRTKEGEFFQNGEILFSDGEITLSEILPKHKSRKIGCGALTQYADAFGIAGERFPLGEIRAMAAVQAHLLLFSSRGKYYELRAKKPANLRKYLIYFNTRKD